MSDVNQEDSLKVGDSVYVIGVELPNIMDHLLYNTFVITKVRDCSDRPFLIHGPSSKNSKYSRSWYFGKNELVSCKNKTEIFKTRKLLLDQKFKKLSEEFAEFQKDLLESKEKTVD